MRGVCGDLPDVSALDTDQHVLRLDVRVDDLALRVQVVQALKYLKATHLFLKRCPSRGGRTWDILFFIYFLFSLSSSTLDHSASAPPLDLYCDAK